MLGSFGWLPPEHGKSLVLAQVSKVVHAVFGSRVSGLLVSNFLKVGSEDAESLSVLVRGGVGLSVG